MRILLLGKGGQLGWEARRCLNSLGEVTALDYPEMDFSDLKSLENQLQTIKPQLIFNAAAYTAVDKAEEDIETAFKVNSHAPGLMMEWAQKNRAVLVHFSTDYVFDGKTEKPYTETDQTLPLNEYGKSKLDGEKNIIQVGGAYLIFRTAWVYSRRAASFMGKVLAWSRKMNELKIVSDQVGSPTWSRLLAEVSSQVITKAGNDPYDWVQAHHGLYHLAGEGAASRLEWASQILALDPDKEEQLCQNIIPSKTTDFPTTAERPLYTALDCSKFKSTFGLSAGDWLAGLRLAMEMA